MADKKTHRREQKMARRRAKAKDKSAVVRARRRGGASALTAARAASWPVNEAYVSEDWHEQGPRIHAILSRARDDGQLAAVLFDLDLRERGVVDAQTELEWTVPNLQRALVERSADKAMITCDAELVVKLVEEAARHGAAGGHSQAHGLERARALFGDLDAASCHQDVLVGETPPAAPDKKAGGIMASIKKVFVRR